MLVITSRLSATGGTEHAVVTHPMVHLAAVVHQRNGGSTQMLPPKVTTDYPVTETGRSRRPGRQMAARHRRRLTLVVRHRRAARAGRRFRP
jgi:hypothetical protein